MKKEVIAFTCDNCKDTKTVDKSEGKDLPEGWGDIIMQINGHPAHTLDLCTLCVIAVGNALGERNKA